MMTAEAVADAALVAAAEDMDATQTNPSAVATETTTFSLLLDSVTPSQWNDIPNSSFSQAVHERT